MHLPKLPTIFVKDGEERKAFFTVEARELVAEGWVEKGESKPAAKTSTRTTAKSADTEKTEEEKPKAEKPKAVTVSEPAK